MPMLSDGSVGCRCAIGCPGNLSVLSLRIGEPDITSLMLLRGARLCVASFGGTPIAGLKEEGSGNELG